MDMEKLPNIYTKIKKYKKYNKYIMKYFNLYIILILILKIIFFSLSMIHLYLKFKKLEDSDLNKNVEMYRSNVEFIYTMLMSFLLIYLFNPYYSNIHLIRNETRILLYLFGFILLLTANWSLYFGDSIVINIIQDLVKYKK